MASSGLRRGLDLYLYRNTGSYGSPTWALITNCRDFELGLTRTRIDSSTRAVAVATKVPGLIEMKPKWQMIYDYSDAALIAIYASFYATSPTGAQIEFAFSDGAVGGSNIRYIRAICCVFDVSEPAPLDGLGMVNVEVEPTYNSSAGPTVNTA